ncbi:MAG: NUDIX hydrolase [Patescibacteria group bacterium]
MMLKPVILGLDAQPFPCKAAGIIVRSKEDKTLFVDRRKGTLGWACPAGHLETDYSDVFEKDFFEDPAHCAWRELREETAVVLPAYPTILKLHANIAYNTCGRPAGQDGHEWYVYYSEVDDDHVELKEPDKHRGIGWFKRQEIQALELEPVWRLILNHLQII